jgi:nicotinamide riboside kinase
MIRISIIGIENSGKTRLTKDLAEYFSTNFVIDYNNLIYKSVEKEPDYIEVINSRRSLENWVAKSSNKILFIDSCDIQSIWEIKSKKLDTKDLKKIEENIIKEKSDFYLVTKTDKTLSKLISKFHLNYKIIEKDSYEEMRKIAITEIEKRRTN